MSYAELMRTFSEASMQATSEASVEVGPTGRIAGYRRILNQLPVKFDRETSAESSVLIDFPSDYDGDIASAFGIPKLYSHQFESLSVIRAGRNIVIKTATASGKTVAFNAPVLEGVIGRQKTALYIYPLKALADDQLGKIQELNARLSVGKRLKVCVLTGDIPMDERLTAMNAGPDIVMISPDCLNHQLYKQKKGDWASWARFVKRLGYVVVDEAHTYTGSFGANVRHLMSRLKIAVDFCDGKSEQLQWLVATATIGNPVEFASALTGCDAESFGLIEKSGAGSHGRIFACLKPEVDTFRSTERSVRACQSSGLNLKGIIFANTRGEVKALQGMLRQKFGEVSAAYYGGLRQQTRHSAIQGLANGSIDWIVSTSALEAGIDIEAVDVCICVGFAGSIMSHNQRIGRAGRKGPALVVFIPRSDDPLDSFYSAVPSRLFGKPESGLLSADYPVFMAQHLACCGCESQPHLDEIKEHFGERGVKIAQFMAQHGEGSIRQNRLMIGGYPHMKVSLRGSTGQAYKMLDNGRKLEEISGEAAHKEAHPGALYASFESGKKVVYRCDSFDPSGVIKVHREIDQNRSTRSQSFLDVTPLEELKSQLIDLGNGARFRLSLYWSKISICTSAYREDVVIESRSCNNPNCTKNGIPVNGSHKKCKSCGREIKVERAIESLGPFPIEPALWTAYEAPALRIEINPALLRQVDVFTDSVNVIDKHRQVALDEAAAAPDFAALHSLGHALCKALPLSLLCSQSDLDCYVVRRASSNEGLVGTQMFLHDTIEGGTGSAEAVYNSFEQVAADALLMSTACDCASGCPRCLSEFRCRQGNKALLKQSAQFLLQLITTRARD